MMILKSHARYIAQIAVQFLHPRTTWSDNLHGEPTPYSRLLYRGHFSAGVMTEVIKIHHLMFARARGQLCRTLQGSNACLQTGILYTSSRQWLCTAIPTTYVNENFYIHQNDIVYVDLTWDLSPASHLLGPLSWYPTCKWSHCNSFEDRAPVDEIYGCPIFEWVAGTWLKDRVPG